MNQPEAAPYGSWRSPITSDRIVSGTVGLRYVQFDKDDVYWIESRPTEGGRNVLVKRRPNGETFDVTPPEFNVRTRVHEYGGGSYLVHEGVAYFSNFTDQRLYRQAEGEPPAPITPDTALRYADGIFDVQRGRIICVREDHRDPTSEAVNTLVALDPEGDEDGGTILASDHDFYSNPRLSQDGRQLAWLTWDHPRMPWDGTDLWVADIQSDGSLGAPQHIAGGESESIFQPQWSPNGTLTFVSDRSGWWNLYQLIEGGIEPLVEMEAEFGLPQWVFGMSTYGFVSADQIVCKYGQDGTDTLAHLDLTTGTLEAIETPYTTLSFVRCTDDQVAFIGGAPDLPHAVVLLDLNTGETIRVRQSTTLDIDRGYLTLPEAIEFPTEDDKTAHAFFYPPKNKDFIPPEDELPPLLVLSHGGPTSATTSSFNLSIQYWTSRGIAVLDVNYGGSTGYGREYRERLEGNWGVVDVNDCANGAQFLAEQERVDGERLIIRGGSAGGYTTLCALTFRDVFEAGASYYGIGNLEALTEETHKFESRYLDRLVGPHPERRDLYIERSPIHHTEQLSCPLIFFQGLEDKVVPPDQAEEMVSALREKGLPVAYVTFEGEQHGFRRSENIKKALDSELYFYSQVFDFTLAEPVEPVEIENLD